VHEASHIVVDVLHFGPEGVFASVAATAKRGGMVVRPRPGRLLTAEDYGRRLQAILAGRVGETMVFGKPSHGAGGDGGDIDQGTQLACAMICSLGLAGPTPLLYRGVARSGEDILRFPDVRRARQRRTRGTSNCVPYPPRVPPRSFVVGRATAAGARPDRWMGSSRADRRCVERIRHNVLKIASPHII